MNKKCFMLSFFFITNATCFYAHGMSTTTRLLAVAVGTGATFATSYVGATSSQVGFDRKKTFAALQRDREFFVKKEMEFYKSSQEKIEKEYNNIHTQVKNWINKKD